MSKIRDNQIKLEKSRDARNTIEHTKTVAKTAIHSNLPKKRDFEQNEQKCDSTSFILLSLRDWRNPDFFACLFFSSYSGTYCKLGASEQKKKRQPHFHSIYFDLVCLVGGGVVNVRPKWFLQSSAQSANKLSKLNLYTICYVVEQVFAALSHNCIACADLSCKPNKFC